MVSHGHFVSVYLLRMRVQNFSPCLNNDLANISVWMAANKLSLNKSKTEYMLIGSHQKLKQCNSDLQIIIGDTLIQRVTATKSLCMMIDETLTWHSNTDLITKKVNRGLHVLKRLRDLVDMGTLVTVYKTLIQPHFDYCSQVGVVLELPFKTICNDYKTEQYVLSQSVVMNSGQPIYLKN